MMEIYPRWQHDEVGRALKTRRVLMIAGARQCGKTTLALQLKVKDAIYRTLDDSTLLEAAVSDPKGFLQHDASIMIIDEVQRAPVLLTALKYEVDTKPVPGRFLLTGSSNIQSLPGVNESLAGRISKIRLYPLSVGEILGTNSSFIERAFKSDWQLDKSKHFTTKDDYLNWALHGGYPEARTLSFKQAKMWYRDYLDALIERDLKDISNIKRHDGLTKLLQVVAAWSSKFLDKSALSAKLSLNRSTVESYISALEALYLIDKLPSWSKTDYSRIGKREKIFVTDTGLMSAILRWNLDKVRFDGELNGKLIETFVYLQLAAICCVHKGEYEMYHYYDREKREIDIIIENDDGDLLGIEVKAGTNISRQSFKHIEWFRKNLVKNQKVIGIVLYTGEEVLSFGEDMWAVPISSIWGA